MKVNLQDLISGKIVLPEEPKKELKRPDNEVDLENNLSEFDGIVKSELPATDELNEIKVSLSDPLQTDLSSYELDRGYLIRDINTCQIFVVPSKKALNNNFIYRDDLDIREFSNKEEFREIAQGYLELHPVGALNSRVQYILDEPAIEKYTPYYNHQLVIDKYGVTTPRGCFIRKYKDRFERDIALLKMDSKYKELSKSKAGEVVKELKSNQAIIVSDGAYIKNCIASSVLYMDNLNIISLASCGLPSIEDQSVLIAEIVGATNALKLAIQNNKKKITYFYDNTSIINCFNNRKLEYIDEVKAFKELIIDMHAKKYDVTFLEIHPKTLQEDEADNARLLDTRKTVKYIHNFCDSVCTGVVNIYVKGYREKIIVNSEKTIKLQDLVDKHKQQTNKRRR